MLDIFLSINNALRGAVCGESAGTPASLLSVLLRRKEFMTHTTASGSSLVKVSGSNYSTFMASHKDIKTLRLHK